MKIGWTIVYILASIWLVGTIMLVTGQPFGKQGLIPATPRAAIVAPVGDLGAGSELVVPAPAKQLIVPARLTASGQRA